MIVGLVLSLIVAWASFMGMAASILVSNSAGMVYYGIGLILGGVATRVFFDRI